MIEYDIDLFEQDNLYDINTVGSMFKAWLRELPDEIFPKATQAMIAEKCMGATKTPQLLKDELSKLPPHNYYLLFAVTCHLNLLHSYVDQNKMDYRNLCICFQPCMKIDGFCFQFLVQDWKNCWQGCWTEKEYLEVELRLEREGREPRIPEHINDRAISSSDSSQHPSGQEKEKNQGQNQAQQQTQILSQHTQLQSHSHNSGNNKNDSKPSQSTAKSTSQPQPSSRKAVPKRLESPNRIVESRKRDKEKENSTSTPLKNGTGKNGNGVREKERGKESQLPELGPPLSPIQI